MTRKLRVTHGRLPGYYIDMEHKEAGDKLYMLWSVHFVSVYGGALGQDVYPAVTKKMRERRLLKLTRALIKGH